MRNKNQSNIPFIHLLRSLSALFVIWAHLAGAWYAGTYHVIWWGFQSFRDYVSIPLHLYQDGAHLGVVLFFLISGYVISLVGEQETFFEFAVKRYFRIFPTLYLALIAVWLAARLSTTIGLEPMKFDGTPAEYLANAALISEALSWRMPLPSSWSLYVEMIFYTTFAFAIALAGRSAVKSTLLIMTIGWALMLPALWSSFAAFQAVWFVIYLSYFAIGRAFFLWDRSRIGNATLIALIVANLAVFLSVTAWIRPGYLLEAPMHPIVTYLAAVAIFFLAMVAKIRSLPRPLNDLGDISYALYLLHYPVGYFTMNLLHRAGAPLDLTIGIGILASFGAAWLTTRFFEKPMQKFARRILSRNRTRPDHGPAIEAHEPTLAYVAARL